MKIGNYIISSKSLVVFLGAFIVLFNLYNVAWIPLDPYVQRGTFLFVFVLISYLTNPPKSKMAKIFMAVFTVMALVGSLYPVVFSDKLNSQFYYASRIETVIFPIFVIGLAGVLTRVDGGVAVLILMVIALLYLFFGQYIPGMFGHNPMTMEFITTLLYTDVNQGVFGSFTDTFVRIVSIFIIFAAFLYISGLGELFTAVASRLAGNATGGPAKVSVLSSAAFGMISGSPVANVVATGSFTIPTMKNVGYRPEMAATVEALASTGGMLVPPVMGAVAFLMSDILAIPYLQVCVIALVPAFLWYFTCYCIVHFYALSVKIKKWQPSKAEVMAVIKAKYHFLFAIIGLVGALYYFVSAEQAAFYSVVFLFLLTFIRKETRLTKAKLVTFLETYVGMFCGLFVVVAALAIFVSAFTGSGAHLKLGAVLLSGIEQWYVVLLLVFALTLVLGMGITPVGVYLAAAAIAVPILAELKFNPISAHMFVFYVSCLAPITPPVALASFQAAKLAGSGLMRTSLVAMIASIPLWIFPFVLTRKNLFLGIGTPLDYLLTELAIICTGILLFVVGVQGFFRRKLSLVEKILAVVISLMILQPVSDYFSKVFFVVGVLLFIFWFVSYFLSTRKAAKTSQVENSS